MKKKIDQLLSGHFEYELPGLVFSQDRISVTIPAGETLQSELYFSSADERRIRGMITSSSRRLVPGLTTFSGETIRLTYGIDAAGMRQGDTVEGRLTFITSVGEESIPFEIRTQAQELQTGSGSVRTLEDFAELARRDFREAFHLFTSVDFAGIIQGESNRYQALLKGFSRQPVTYQHLEEFLISTKQKKPVSIKIAREKAEYFEVKESRRESVVIIRSGWGHLRLDIEAQGGFIEPTRKVITQEDFIGSRCELEYVIRADMLQKGRRRARLLIRSPYQTLSHEILASREPTALLRVSAREKAARLTLHKDYLRYLCQETSFEEWAHTSHSILAQLHAEGIEAPGYQMFTAWLLHQEKRDEEAVSILKKYMDKTYSRQEIDLAGAFLYLCLITGLAGEREQIQKRVQNLYMQKGDSMLLLWVLLQLDPELSGSPARSLVAMEELYDRGCRSPFLYMEAWRSVCEDPSAMHQLSGFWTQVMAFAARRGLLQEELTRRFAYLAGYEKEYRPLVATVLEKCCRVFPSDETLQALCKYIIRGNPRRAEYFCWFEQAVRHGLRLTRLYEYYVETMDTSVKKSLPRNLLMYFKYNSDTLGDSKKAFIYAGVVQDKEKDRSTYEMYKANMKEFTQAKLAQGAISTYYAILYREFFSEPATGADALAVARLLFTCRIYTDEPRVRQVIVRHDQLMREEIYPVIKGAAYPRIYTDDAVILFQDEKQRRYEATVQYSRERLLEDPALARRVLGMGVEEPGVLLNYAENHQVEASNLLIFENLCTEESFSIDYRRQVQKRLLDYFTENSREETLDDYLKALDLREYAYVDKARVLSLLIERGLYVQAMQLEEEFGWEGVDPRYLLRLASRRIEEVTRLAPDAEQPDDELLAMADYIFDAGFFDETTLTYLMKWRTGPVDKLLSLREHAEGFGLDTCDLEEKLLSVLMFTSDYRKEGETVLASYLRHGGKEKIACAYLCQMAYGTFVKEYPMSHTILSLLYKAYVDGWETDRICHLALLKELSRGKADHLPVARTENELLAECVEDGLRFAFFRRLLPRQLAPWQLDDKVFVEIHEDPAAKVTLFYRLDTGLGSHSAYTSEPIPNVYQGIFNRGFTLFYGESIHYYFQVETEGKSRRTSERALTMNRVETASASKYQRINQMLASRRLGKEREVREKMQEYLRQEQSVREMFRLR